MRIKFLYSDIEPLKVKEDQEIISDCFRKELSKASELRISVGYCGGKSLKELDRLVNSLKIKKVSLILGMYKKDDFPAHIYQLSLEINKKWQEKGIGEIRVTKHLRYHGKLYCFYKDGQIFSVISGSANLSFLFEEVRDAQKYPQYEMGFLIKDPDALNASSEHINDLLTIPGATERIDKTFSDEIKDYVERSKNF